jgi:UDP:flavonoid glycosyltransferase YjiC (YdhE family)
MHFDGAAVTEAPDWVENFGRTRPGIYITFGTEMAASAPWPAIVEALGSLDAEAVVTLGSAIDPATLGAAPANVRIEKYVPQSFILDRASVVVSHAGSGTLFAAAARGIPQLCVPIAADQWSNSDALSAAGAAITLELDQRSAEQIHHALTTLLDEPSYGVAARALSLDFAALPHPREHVATLEALI